MTKYENEDLQNDIINAVYKRCGKEQIIILMSTMAPAETLEDKDIYKRMEDLTRGQVLREFKALVGQSPHLLERLEVAGVLKDVFNKY